MKKLAHFPYNFNNIFILLILFTVISIAVVVPPMQSPDESDHIQRAYYLSTGHLFLQNVEGKNSGGFVDENLVKYVDLYKKLRFNNKNKLNASLIQESKTLKWSNRYVFSEFPGTGYYLPFIYSPQALALIIGRTFKLTIDESYFLCKYFLIFLIGLLLFFSLKSFNPNFLFLSVISLPMYLFLFSTTSPDGLIIAISIFTISTYNNVLNTYSLKVSSSDFFLLSVQFFILITSKIFYLPLIFLLIYVAFFFNSKKFKIVSFININLILVWFFIATISITDLRSINRAGFFEVFFYYLNQPFDLMNIYFFTFINDFLLNLYNQSFIGVLGWLDTFFEEIYYTIYNFLFSFFLFVTYISFRIRKNYFEILVVLLSFILTIFVIFFALLVNWNPHPLQTTIKGVQGRYFLIPFLFLISTIFYEQNNKKYYIIKFSKIILIYQLMFSAWLTLDTIIKRYYFPNY